MDEVSIINDLHDIYTRAILEDVDFYTQKYLWRLGAYVLNNIEVACNLIFNSDGPTTLFGIVVEPDYVNPYNIQLWKNITEEV